MERPPLGTFIVGVEKTNLVDFSSLVRTYDTLFIWDTLKKVGRVAELCPKSEKEAAYRCYDELAGIFSRLVKDSPHEDVDTRPPTG